MGKVKRRGRLRAWFRNLSFRMSYVCYTLAALVLSTIACSILLNQIDAIRMCALEQELLAEYTVPENGFARTSYIGGHFSITLYNENGGLEQSVRERQGTEVYPVFGGEVGSDVITVRVYESLTARQEQLDMLLGLAYALTFPLCFGGGAALCALVFFRNKMKKPLALLENAAAKIAENNLDFALAYDRTDEMGRLCASFEAMRAALCENNRRMWRAMEERKRLNAAFAHDLRTPLFVLRGYADMLSEQAGVNCPPEKARDMALAIAKNARRLEGFVEDMSRLQKLEDIEARFADTQPRELAERLESAARLVCGERSLACEFRLGDLPDCLPLDAAIVEQAFENLLSNAARHAESRVCVSVLAEGGALLLCVENDGAPFTAEQLKCAQLPYYTSAGGRHFGLGLYITALLCEKHGGSLSLSNSQSGRARVDARFGCGGPGV